MTTDDAPKGRIYRSGLDWWAEACRWARNEGWSQEDIICTAFENGRAGGRAEARPRVAPEVVETLARMAKQADAMGFAKQAALGEGVKP